MKIRNRAGAEENISKEDFESLKANGHADHLTVLDETDFEPSELSMPPAKPADPAKGKDKKDGDGPKA